MNTRRYLSVLAATMVLALMWTASAQAQKRQKIAILGLEIIDEGQGIDAKTTELANKVTQALRQRPGQMAAPYALAPNSNKDLLEMKLLSNCGDEGDACMAAIGKELGADILLYGKLSKLTDGFQITLTRLDVSNRNKQALTAKLSNSEATKRDEINKWANKHYIRIMRLPEEGTLVITANVDSGTVFVDRESRETLSGGKARVKAIKAGKREIAIEAPGHKRYTEEVEIEIGETTRLDAQLEAGAMVRPDEPIAGPGEGPGEGPSDGGGGRPGGIWRIATWGFTAAALASGGYWGYSFKETRDSKTDVFDEFGKLSLQDQRSVDLIGEEMVVDCKNGIPEPGAGDDPFTAIRNACSDGQAAADRTTYLVPITLVAGTAAIASFYLGYIAPDSPSSSSERASRSKKSRERSVQVAPVFTPTYTGGAVRIEF